MIYQIHMVCFKYVVVTPCKKVTTIQNNNKNNNNSLTNFQISTGYIPATANASI
jgi:hypothetical protein